MGQLGCLAVLAIVSLAQSDLTSYCNQTEGILYNLTFNRCILYKPTTANWQQASDSCKLEASSNGLLGRLAWIRNFEIWQKVMAYTAKLILSTTNIWLGAEFNTSVNAWFWVNGNSSFPVNSTGIVAYFFTVSPSTMRCLKASDSITWSSSSCNDTMPYLCEFIDIPLLSTTIAAPTEFVTSAPVDSSISDSIQLSTTTAASTEFVKSAPADSSITEAVTTGQLLTTMAPPSNTSQTVPPSFGISPTTRPAIFANSGPPPLSFTESEKIIINVLRCLGCAYIIGMLSFIIILFHVILRVDTFERWVHFGQEASLLIAHIDLLFLCEYTSNHKLCVMSGVICQYFFTLLFIFILVEAIQIYYVSVDILDPNSEHRGFASTFNVFVIAFGVSFIITSIGFAFVKEAYAGDYTCWLNFDANGVGLKAFYLPVIFLISITIVLLEAASKDCETRFRTASSKHRLDAALINQGSLFILIPTNVAAMVIGQSTIHYQNIALYALTFGLNVANACAILIFHALGDPEFRHAVNKGYHWSKIMLRK